MRQDFYVYEHLRKTDGSVFYVGKGFGGRALRKTNRNKHWHNIVNKHGFDVRFVVKDVDEELSLLAEIERIDQLKKLGAKLCNLTNGGEGVLGYVATAETRKKLSEAHIGRKIPKWLSEKYSVLRKGKPKSEECKLKISKSNTGKIRSQATKDLLSGLKSFAVVCIETGVEYKNAYVAESQTGISRSGINRVCRGERKTAGGYHWRYK
jgi:hypothetical protein